MSCKSGIYTNLVGYQVGPNGQIPFGTIVRRYGQDIQSDGMSLTCCERGYYDIDCTLTVTPVDAGNVGVQLYADGMPVPGATQTGAGVAGSPLALSIAPMVRQRCCGATSLSMRLVSPDGATTGATVDMATRVERG